MLTHRQLITFIILLSLLRRLWSRTNPQRSQLYAANPVFNVSALLRRPGDFRNLLHLEPSVFFSHLVGPLFDHEKLPRHYLVRDDYAALGYVEKLRSTQLAECDKICRYVLFTRDVSPILLSILYDQCLSNTYADIHHQSILFVDKLSDVHINPIVPGSRRYFEKIGSGAFRHFPSALYAMDIVKIQMCTPGPAEQAEYFDGHTRHHNFGYCLMIDKDGECCGYAGHAPGRANDIDIWYNSDMHRNPAVWFGEYDCKVLADGIFARIAPTRFIVPICYVQRDLTEYELRFNYLQAWDRAIIENFNNRLKQSCNYLSYFTFGIESINAIMVSCIILTNIRIRYQDRLRYTH